MIPDILFRLKALRISLVSDRLALFRLPFLVYICLTWIRLNRSEVSRQETEKARQAGFALPK